MEKPLRNDVCSFRGHKNHRPHHRNGAACDVMICLIAIHLQPIGSYSSNAVVALGRVVSDEKPVGAGNAARCPAEIRSTCGTSEGKKCSLRSLLKRLMCSSGRIMCMPKQYLLLPVG